MTAIAVKLASIPCSADLEVFGVLPARINGRIDNLARLDRARRRTEGAVGARTG